MTTYTQLTADLDYWLARDGEEAAQYPALIRMAESEIRRTVRAQAQEQIDTAFAITGRYVPVPADLIEVRALTLNSSRQTRINYMTPEQITQLGVWSGGGIVSHYSILSGNQFVFAPEPEGTETAVLVYYAAFPAINSTTQPTNWLLTNHYDIYLYGCLKHAAPLIGEDERLGLWASLYTKAIVELNRVEERQRFGKAPLVVSGPVGA